MRKILILFCMVGAMSSFGASALELYGFVLPVWTTGSAGVESFGQPNMTAYTAASNPVTQTSRLSGRSGFHVGQSRAGLLVHPIESVSARLEFDFIDFTKATPTTTQLPRVRRAYVEFPLSSSVTMAIGQDWDIVSPLAPHSFNLVGHMFEAGDMAFMRLQARATLKMGDWEHTLAVGFPTATMGSSDGTNELGMLPVIETAESVALSPFTKIGVNGVAASLRANSGTRFFAGAISGFFSSQLHTNLEFRSEIYYARNGYNLGLLSLGYGNGSVGVSEAGAYLSTRLALGTLAIFGAVGSAWALIPSDVLAAYNPTTLASSNSGPGLERNSSVRLGLEYSFHPNCIFFTEFAYLNTHHHLALANVGVNPVTDAALNQTGVQVKL